MSPILPMALQATDDGVFLPENTGSAVVWVVFLGIVIALYVIISRTRRRAEDQFWERKRREKEQRNRPEPQDPAA